MEKLFYWLYAYGVKIGLPLNIIVLAWDVPMWVSRGFMEYSIRGKGAFLLAIGTLLCVFGEISEVWVDNKTK